MATLTGARCSPPSTQTRWSGAMASASRSTRSSSPPDTRPSLDYLRELGALDADAAPIHLGGISSTHVGLVYLGLEFQRSFASNALRGVSDDAQAVIPPLAAWIRDAPIKVGL